MTGHHVIFFSPPFKMYFFWKEKQEETGIVLVSSFNLSNALMQFSLSGLLSFATFYLITFLFQLSLPLPGIFQISFILVENVLSLCSHVKNVNKVSRPFELESYCWLRASFFWNKILFFM